MSRNAVCKSLLNSSNCHSRYRPGCNQMEDIFVVRQERKSITVKRFWWVILNTEALCLLFRLQSKFWNDSVFSRGRTYHLGGY